MTIDKSEFKTHYIIMMKDTEQGEKVFSHHCDSDSHENITNATNQLEYLVAYGHSDQYFQVIEISSAEGLKPIGEPMRGKMGERR